MLPFLFLPPPPHRTKNFFTKLCGWIGACWKWGEQVGSVMLESPEGWGKGAEDLLCGPGQARWRLTFEKRQGPGYPFWKPLTHPHSIKYTKSNTVLH